MFTRDEVGFFAVCRRAIERWFACTPSERGASRHLVSIAMAAGQHQNEVRYFVLN
jgi:hypothetical protein